MYKKVLVRLVSLCLVSILLLVLLVGSVAAQDEVVLTFGISRRVDTLDNTATAFSSVEVIVGHVFRYLGQTESARQFPSGFGYQLDQQRGRDRIYLRVAR